MDLTALTDGATGWAGPLRNALTALDTDKLGATEASATYARPVVMFQGTPDAVVVMDVTTTAASAVITSASGPFLPAHVGMTISVGQAGSPAGADLITTVASYQSATQVTLAATATTAITNAGMVVGSDNGPALQAALTALLAGSLSGGDLSIPKGKYALWTPVSQNYGATNLPAVRIIGKGTASRIFVGTGPTTTAITLANLQRLTLESLTFVGNPTSKNDATTSLSLQSIPQVIFRDCGFYGLANGCLGGDVGNRGVIEGPHSDLKFERCDFGGCGGSSGINNSVIRLADCVGFSAEGTEWIDWGLLDGITYSKTPFAGALAWVELASYTVPAQASARDQSVFRLTDCRMDEGAYFGVYHHPATGRARHIVIDGLQQNVNGGSTGMGLKLLTAVNVTVRDSWIGYQVATQDAINLSDITGVAHLERVITANGASRVTASASVAVLNVIECAITTLVSTAAKTNITKAGAVQVFGSLKTGAYGPVVANRQIGDSASTAVLDFGAHNWPTANPAVAATAIGFESGGAVRISGVNFYTGTGAPTLTPTANGDLYFRLDGGAGTTIYQRRAGAWVATGA